MEILGFGFAGFSACGGRGAWRSGAGCGARAARGREREGAFESRGFGGCVLFVEEVGDESGDAGEEKERCGRHSGGEAHEADECGADSHGFRVGADLGADLGAHALFALGASDE